MSRYTTRHPSLYDIRLTLDPDQEHYTGTVIAQYPATAEAAAAVPASATGQASPQSLLLHARDLAIHSCTLQQPGTTGTSLAFTLDPTAEAIHIQAPPAAIPGIPDAFPTSEFTLDIEFSGTLKHDNRGIYLAAYTEEGLAKNAIVSQFEENDARKAFPCLDEPAAKAVFRISLIIPSRCSAISNGDIATQRQLDAMRKLVLFDDTPVMSSYLVFIAVGEFSTLERTVGGISFRSHAVAGRASLGTQALDFAAESLLHLMQYTGADYPFKKLDLIACPDFAFGAMENYAAISYRENLMLFDPATGSRDELERVGQVTSHEVAHMWFGDLVSPDSWDSVWLNESLATYFGYLVNDTTHPEWDGMHRFMLDSFQSALERDSLDSTIPIEFPAGTNYEMSPAVTPIIYSKAASILRMLHHFLGDDTFQAIVRRYLEAHAYGIAGSDEFLDSFTPSIDRAIPAFWMRTAGYPVVHAERRGNQIILSQQRFNINKGASASDASLDDASPLWPIPLCIGLIHADGRREERTVLFATKNLELDLVALAQGPGSTNDILAIELNTGRSGFYRVAYSPDLLASLGQALDSGFLGDEERAGLIDDLFAFLQAGIIEPVRVLDFLSRWCRKETAYLPLATTARALTMLHGLATTQGDAQHTLAPDIAALAHDLLTPWLERYGIHRSADEPFHISYLRTDIVAALFYMQDTAVMEALTGMEEAWAAGISQDPNLEGIIIKAGAATDLGPDDLFERMEKEGEEARRVKLANALLYFPNVRNIERVFDELQARIPARNWASVIAQARFGAAARKPLLAWYRAHHEVLEGIHPFHAARIMQEILIWGCLGQTEHVCAEVKDMMLAQKHPSPETIQMALEYLEVYNRTAGLLTTH